MTGLAVNELPAYFTARIRLDGECWLWTGPIHDNMPVASKGVGKCRSVRRELYRLDHDGYISPRKVVVLCGCEDACCVAPDHAIATQRGKHVPMAQARGIVLHDAIWHARLTAARRKRAKMSMDKAREVRQRVADGHCRHALAAEFDLHKTMIDKIVRGQNWREPASSGLALIAQQAGML